MHKSVCFAVGIDAFDFEVRVLVVRVRFGLNAKKIENNITKNIINE